MKLWNAVVARNSQTLEDRVFAEGAVPEGWRVIQPIQINMPVDTDNPDRVPIPAEGMKVKGTTGESGK